MMGLSKKAALDLLVVIDEYADAKAEEHWQQDQGYGRAVDDAHIACAEARKNLLLALGLGES